MTTNEEHKLDDIRHYIKHHGKIEYIFEVENKKQNSTKTATKSKSKTANATATETANTTQYIRTVTDPKKIVNIYNRGFLANLFEVFFPR